MSRADISTQTNHITETPSDLIPTNFVRMEKQKSASSPLNKLKNGANMVQDPIHQSSHKNSPTDDTIYVRNKTSPDNEVHSSKNRSRPVNGYDGSAGLEVVLDKQELDPLSRLKSSSHLEEGLKLPLNASRRSFPVDAKPPSPRTNISSQIRANDPETSPNPEKKTPTKSVHAQALAKFVARRRTMSPCASMSSDSSLSEIGGLGLDYDKVPTTSTSTASENDVQASGMINEVHDNESMRGLTQNGQGSIDMVDTSNYGNQVQEKQQSEKGASPGHKAMPDTASSPVTPVVGRSRCSSIASNSPPPKTFSKQPFSLSLDFDLGPLDASSVDTGSGNNNLSAAKRVTVVTDV